MTLNMEVAVPVVTSVTTYSAVPTSASEQRWVDSSSAPGSLANLMANGVMSFGPNQTQMHQNG